MTKKDNAKKRTRLLKRLREEHQESVKHAQAWLIEQNEVRRKICKPLREQARTIPELAKLTDIPSDQILWHITAMKKYGLVVENGMCVDYYQYQMTEGKKK
jgi:predicted transcriptional regulator